MTRERAIEREQELLLRRCENKSFAQIAIKDFAIPECIVDFLSQKEKRTEYQKQMIDRFRDEAITQLNQKSMQILEGHGLKTKEAREARLEQDKRYVKHFGIWVNKTLPSAKISREHYARINPRSTVYSYTVDQSTLSKWEIQNLVFDNEKKTVFYTEEFCRRHQQECLKNYDLNMERYRSISSEKFECTLQRFVRGRKFQQVFSFDEPICKERVGIDNDIDGFVYVMVLDAYKQAYIGITRNTIEERIRQHWKKDRAFDRLIFGTVDNSVISIDSFGPLDTTRIFAKPYEARRKTPLEGYEMICINAFDSKYLLNRLK
ncbi:MAG: hypothetical protein ACI4MM_09350 [Candidatus Ventricola sp.]